MELTIIEDRSKIRNYIFDNSKSFLFLLFGIVLIASFLDYRYNANGSRLGVSLFIIPFVLHYLIQFYKLSY